MKKKTRVGIIFGGKSAEHEVSVRSAQNVYQALDRNKYEPVLVGITKTGHWLFGQTIQELPLGEKNSSLIPAENDIASLDVIFPVLHGPFGEDGTVQGLLKLANIPFVGASVLGSAVGMDKDVMKRLLRDAGIPVAQFLVVHEGEKVDYEKIVKTLESPFFIKPANLGSSVGVSKVKNEKDFKNAITEAFKYDRKVMIEEYIKGREVECSVLGNGDPLASVPGEIIVKDEFYSYNAKYIDENGAALEIPAQLPRNIIKKVQSLALKTYEALTCEGMARVDFFLTKDNEVLVNEINTIPGFTKISMYPKLWEVSGISYSELISRLIDLAFERFKKEQKLKTSY